MDIPPEEERFLTNILDLTYLIHELSGTCYDAGYDVNPTLIMFAAKYLENSDPVTLIEPFIKYSYKFWGEETEDENGNKIGGEIKNRKEEFFINNAHEIFKNLPIQSDKLNAFKILFTATYKNGDDIIDQDERNNLWEMFDTLVKISIKYVHRVRGIVLKSTPNGIVPKYKNPLFTYVKVGELSKIWKIDLPIPGK